MAEKQQWETAVYLYSDEYHQQLKNNILKIAQEKGENCQISDFSSFDTFHPGGHVGLEMLIDEENINSESQILDVGSGLGAASRLIFQKTGAFVYGLDYLNHFVEMSNMISELCKLQNGLVYHQGDINTVALDQNRFDVAYSIAVFCLIPATQGFTTIFNALKPGGAFYIEDYYLNLERDQLTDEHRRILYDGFGIHGVRTENELRTQLEAAGFMVEKFEKFGRVWSEFAWNRSQNLLEKYNQENRTGDETFLQMIENYGRNAVKILTDMDFLTSDELQERYPLTCQEVDFMNLVYTNQNCASCVRLIARKPR